MTIRDHISKKLKSHELEAFIFGMGVAGERYSASQVAEILGVGRQVVVRWIERGWLRASPTTNRGYRIKRRAVRRLLSDFPSAARTVALARERANLKFAKGE